jgi:folate-dependent phosphoribosylglycinamide formyltransferase PurN
MRFEDIKFRINAIRHIRPWLPGRARFLLKNALGAPDSPQHDDQDHLIATAAWLEAAQDSQQDGGIAGRFRLQSGWTSSYPETTGYAIPTLLAVADVLGEERFRERARRAVKFLLSVQLPSGAFPGGEIAQNSIEPSPFNSAQILHGLLSWHRATDDKPALDAALRAADWLLSVQESDGSWVKYFYNGVACDYAAHLACRLAELGAHTGEKRYLHSASRHLDWVLDHYEHQSGWFPRAGWWAKDHAVRRAFVHTIAYTIWGVLESSEILAREDGVAAALHAARKVARRIELSRWLPGILDAQWRGLNHAACLTGNCQMAVIWLRLYQRTGDAILLNAALKAIHLVKCTQEIDNPDPGIRGGVAGSFPVWGEYIASAMPNWAAKYFIDALIAKSATLSKLPERRPLGFTIPPRLPRALPAAPPSAKVWPQRIVLVTSAGSAKVQGLVAAWESWSFQPAAVVIERESVEPAGKRLLRIVRNRGISGLLRRLVLRKSSASHGDGPEGGRRRKPEPVAEFCAARGIRTIEVKTLDAPSELAPIREVQPDLFVHAGAGIIRPPLLAISRLGMINAHMGILPFYRGMNVSEWAAFNGDPIGCSVHLIDQGIDTGDILVIRPINAADATNIAALRALVDAAQVELLGEVVRYVTATGELPPRYPQRPEEGCQFFVMHRDLRARLESELASAG